MTGSAALPGWDGWAAPDTPDGPQRIVDAGSPGPASGGGAGIGEVRGNGRGKGRDRTDDPGKGRD